MKAQEFSNMSHENKVRTVWKSGKYAGKRHLDKKTYIIYSFKNLFIELIYDETNKLVKIEPVTTDFVASNYLKNVKYVK